MSSPGLRPGFLDGLDCAEYHVVVVRINALDVRAIGLEEGLHDLFALCAGEIAGLGCDDLDVRIFRCHQIFKALLAVVRSGGAHCAFELYDLAAVADQLRHFVGCVLASSMKSEPMNVA